MKTFAAIFKDHKPIMRAKAESRLSDPALALQECLEVIYKELDLSEPVWVKKHARELGRSHRTKFLASDFMEPVSFDYLEIECVF